MTLKEKVAEIMPESIDDKNEGGVLGCPTAYDFLNVTEIFCCDDCEKCWNAEFVEEEKAKMTIDGMINRLQDNLCMCDGASDSNCNKCMQNNLQLVEYLKELDYLRKENKKTKELVICIGERLEHLLESDYIALFDEKNKDGTYKYDITEAGLPIEGLNTSYSTVQKLNKPVATSETAVDHPAHYQGKHECIEVMRVLFGDRAVMDFCKLNSYKYRFRADKKNGAEDIKKAEWYEDYLIKMQEEQEEKRKSDGAW